MRWTVYLDLDAYYVSVELRDRPELKGKPVIVGPSPKLGPSRGVVLSASYEARAFGVHSAQPVGQADRSCPQAIWIPADFPKYERVAHEVREFLSSMFADVVPHSIDEASVRVNAGSIEEIRGIALDLQSRLNEKFALPCSIGVAMHRIVAKIATDQAKPGGVRVVAPAEVAPFLAPLPVRVVPGVGRKTEEVLRSIGILTIGDLSQRRASDLRRRLGSFADDLIALSKGQPREAEEERDDGPKSRSSERTFEADLDDRARIDGEVRSLAGELAESLQREEVRFQTVVVALRWEDFERTQRGRTLTVAQESAKALADQASRLFAELWEDEQQGKLRKVRMVSVRAERLLPARAHQARLDSYPGEGAVLPKEGHDVTSISGEPRSKRSSLPPKQSGDGLG